MKHQNFKISRIVYMYVIINQKKRAKKLFARRSYLSSVGTYCASPVSLGYLFGHP